VVPVVLPVRAALSMAVALPEELASRGRTNGEKRDGDGGRQAVYVHAHGIPGHRREHHT